MLTIGEELKELILSDLCYKPNDVIEFSSNQYLNCPGMLTSSRTNIHFTFQTDKSLKNINSFQLETLRLNVRGSYGGYIGTNSYVSGGYDFFNDPRMSFVIQKVGERNIGIRIISTEVLGENNNIPVTVSLDTIKLKLN